MLKRTRRIYTPTFKAKVALAAIRGGRTLAELAQQYDVHPNQVTAWKAHLVEAASAVFGAGCPVFEHTPGCRHEDAARQDRELTLESDFLSVRSSKLAC